MTFLIIGLILLFALALFFRNPANQTENKEKIESPNEDNLIDYNSAFFAEAEKLGKYEKVGIKILSENDLHFVRSLLLANNINSLFLMKHDMDSKGGIDSVNGDFIICLKKDKIEISKLLNVHLRSGKGNNKINIIDLED